MNYLLLTIISSIILYVIEFYLDIRQYFLVRSSKLPDRLRKYITDKEFKEMQTYNLLRLSFSRLQSTYGVINEIGILLWEVLGWFYTMSIGLNNFIFDWSPNDDHQIAHGITFLFTVSFFSAFIKAPFELYRISVIDSKFVESTEHTSRALLHWFLDQLKMFILAVIVGCPLLGLILKLMHIGNAFHWSYIWMGSIALSVGISELYPNYLQPLFYKVDQFPECPFKHRILSTISNLGFPKVKDLVLLEGSTGDNHANAIIMKSSSRLRIAIYEGLLNILTEDEVLAILVHELGHYKSRHSIKEMGIQICSMAIFLFSLSRCIYDINFYKSFGFNQVNPAVGLLLFSYFYESIGSIVRVFSNIIHRQFEYNCDLFAEQNGHEIDEALIKMHVSNVFNLVVDKHYSRYYNSHPSLLERLNNIRLYREYIARRSRLVFSESLDDLVDLAERESRKKEL